MFRFGCLHWKEEHDAYAVSYILCGREKKMKGMIYHAQTSIVGLLSALRFLKTSKTFRTRIPKQQQKMSFYLVLNYKLYS